jgi:hypothetical protein
MELLAATECWTMPFPLEILPASHQGARAENTKYQLGNTQHLTTFQLHRKSDSNQIWFIKGTVPQKVFEFLTWDGSFSLNLGSPTLFKILK